MPKKTLIDTSGGIVAAIPVNECSLCGGELQDLGTLGWTQHLRCRDCGAQFSAQVKAETEEDRKRRARWLRAQRKEKERIQKFGYGT